MHYLLNFRLLTAVLIALLLASCASTQKPESSDSLSDQPGLYKYAAWRPHDSDEVQAINVLLHEADALIEQQALNAAADKLERALRIKPEYAPAWSRLSWLALQVNSPQRSLQMAKRSNSLAQADNALMILNWTFIATASKALNDEATYRDAQRAIDSLKSF